MKNEKIENENEMVHSHLLKRKCYRQDENHLIFKGINWICSVVIARDMQKEKKIYIFIFYARTSYLYIFYIYIYHSLAMSPSPFRLTQRQRENN